MNLKSFKQFTEERTKKISFTFCDFFPPLIEHKGLIESVAKGAKGSDYKIYMDSSDNSLLEHKELVKWTRKIFSKYGRNIVETKAKNELEVMTELYEAGYTDVTVIADVSKFKKKQALFLKFNESRGAHGYYEFNSITVKPSPSIYKSNTIKNLVRSGDINAFKTKLGEGTSDKDVKELFDLLKERLGVTSSYLKLELPTLSSIREQYIKGEIFTEGSSIMTKSNGEILTILERKSNYIVASDGNKYFLDQITQTK